MNNRLMINDHGSKIPVYDINNESRQIGYLNQRETFVMYDTNGSNRLYIYFLDGSGNFVKVVIKDDVGYTTKFYTESPYTTRVDDKDANKKYMVFKMRKSMPVYYSDARRWGTVAANCCVDTDRDLCGSTHPDWLYIKHVQSSSGEWVPAGYTSDGYAFVDTGIRSNSLASGIALGGAW